MTPKEFNRLPLSAKTSIVKDYGKLVDERKENDTVTILTYSVKTAQVESTRFIEVRMRKSVQNISRIKMLTRVENKIPN